MGFNLLGQGFVSQHVVNGVLQMWLPKAPTEIRVISRKYLEIAHKSIRRVYWLQNWVEAQSYWAVLFAKTANAIGLLPEKRDTGNLQKGIVHKCGALDIKCSKEGQKTAIGPAWRTLRQSYPQF